jgi:NMD protein affecting ribosome stability and mRNA decay
MQNRQCPRCEKAFSNSPHPRHLLVLEDESNKEPNQRIEAQLCPDCWKAIRTQVTGNPAD